MKHSAPKIIKRHHSIFAKILFIWVLTVIAIIIIFGTFFRRQFNEGVKTVLHKNIDHYFEYLAQDIGSPPDTTIAAQFARDYSIYIKYESDGFVWESKSISSNTQSHRLLRLRHRPEMVSNQMFVHQNPDGSVFLFQIDYSAFFAKHRTTLFFVILIILIVLALNHSAIRRILLPIRHLQKGVERVGGGQFDSPITVFRHDELGELTESFNQMIKKIKEMLRSRDQLLLDVSHELRSPLTRMKVALEFMPDDKNKASVQSDISEIETMITELLETERLKDGHGKLKLSQCNLSQLIENIVENFKHRSPGIMLKPIPKNIEITIDIERIKIVFKNIIENALKYSLPTSKPVEIKVFQNQNQVTVRIKDNGPGIPEEHLSHLFEPFYRVDKSRTKKTGGYGLGLSLCKKIMDVHDGTIRVFNNENQSGITVELIFR